MARLWRAHLKQITILGRMNDVNVQLQYEMDIPEGVSSISAIKDITAALHAAGLEPPVGGAKQNYRTTGERNGADGTHPDEPKPLLNSSGEREMCPNCGKPLFYATGITKDKNSKNFGQPWKKWFCSKAHQGCGAYNFGDRRDVRFDTK